MSRGCTGKESLSTGLSSREKRKQIGTSGASGGKGEFLRNVSLKMHL